MRIIIVVHGYPPTFTGGAELRAERTARGLAARGHAVAVLCIESLTASEPQLVTEEQRQAGVQVYRLHVPLSADLDSASPSDDDLVMQGALAQLIHDWQPDLVHLFSGYLIGSGVIKTVAAHQVPVIVSLTDYWWLCHRINLVRKNGSRCDGPSPVGCARCHSEMYRRFRLPTHVVRPLADGFWRLAEHVPALGVSLGAQRQADRLQTKLATLQLADALIAPSRFLAQTYQRYGVSAERMHIWRQGVNLELCPLRKPSPLLRFGYLGQIKHHKGVHTLISAWERLGGSRQRSLVLHGLDRGEEAYGAQLRKLTRDMPDVTWAPMVSHAEIWQVLAELDVLVMPSRWYENSPNVILEAQAMGIPVIGSNLGGVAELVQHGRNGLLFAPDDAADLAAQMARLLDESGLLGALRRSPIHFHSFADELDQLEGLYELLATRSAHENHEALGSPPPVPAYQGPPSGALRGRLEKDLG